ncbi:hypothetical protein PBC6_127 [Bacillus phage PBC6]|nr:hypothetical protein PBC6_127 [Bacillus phage PBC6]
MKKLWSNIDFEQQGKFTKWVLPLLCLSIIIGATYGVVTKGWVETASAIFTATYIICSNVIYVQIKVPKKYAIFLVVFGISVGLLAAYEMWSQNWVSGIIDAILALINLLGLSACYIAKGETREEGK